MKNNQSHKFDANRTLYNIAMKGFTLWSRTFIWTSTVCFTVTKWTYATLVYLCVSTKNLGIKSEISGVIWQVSPESKIQLVSYKMSPYFLLGLSALVDMRHRRVYLLWISFIYNVFWSLIYFLQYVHTSFRIFCVLLNLLIWSVQLRRIYNRIILWFTSETRIWFPIVTFITLIIGVAWIKG